MLYPQFCRYRTERFLLCTVERAYAASRTPRIGAVWFGQYRVSRSSWLHSMTDRKVTNIS